MGRKPNGADLLFVNGNVITMEADCPWAGGVAVKDGIIVYLGDNRAVLDSLRDRQTEVIDLHGKTLLPGFIDSHMHPSLYALSLLEIDCRAVSIASIDELLNTVRQRARSTPAGTWLRGWGWDDSKLAERRNPTRQDLDGAAPDHPVILKRTCGHVAAVNTAALRMNGIDAATPDPEGGHIEKDHATGEPTGILQERAQELVELPPYTSDDLKRGLAAAFTHFARWGLTTVHDISTAAFYLQAYQDLLQAEKLTVRLRPWLWALDQMGSPGMLDEAIALGIKSGFGGDMLRIQGSKFMLDGSVGGRTAAVAEPFVGEADNRGILYMRQEDFTPEVVKSINAGLRVAIHAIGERAIEMALTAIEAAAATGDVTRMRNRIEHCGLPTDQQLARMRRLGLVAGSSVGFVYWLGDSYIANLGSERLRRVYPQKSFREHGIVAPANSDLPVCDGNPLAGIYGAVTRKSMSGRVLDDVQNISVLDALRLYTTDAAYASFEEDKLGSLREGKFADLIVLSDDPLQVPAENLKDLRVEMTVMNGKIVYR